MRKLVTVVLTIERNVRFGQQCVEHLKQQGFMNPILKVFPAAPKTSSIRTLNKSIMDNHYNVIRWIAQTYDFQTHDLMICEDDCEFIKPNGAKLVDEQRSVLHSHYDWSVCFVGHLAGGPIFPTRHHQLYWTTLPFMAHCYIFNGQKLCGYLNKIDFRRWRKPFMTEGWLSVPCAQKFAIFPSIATQNRPVKDFRNVPFLSDMSALGIIRMFESFAFALPWIILIVIIGVLLYYSTIRNKSNASPY